MARETVVVEIEECEYADLVADDANANRGTKRGRYQLEQSVRGHGYLEAGTLDKNNRLIGGNKRTEVAHEIGLGKPLIIDIDGSRPVYLRRTNIDLDTPEGRAAALALNRVAQVSIDLDPAVVLQYEELGADLSDLYYPEELDAMLQGLAEAATRAEVSHKDTKAQREDKYSELAGGPESEDPSGEAPAPVGYSIVVEGLTEGARDRLLRRLRLEKYQCRVMQ